MPAQEPLFGSLGTILRTTDGGATWTSNRAGQDFSEGGFVHGFEHRDCCWRWERSPHDKQRSDLDKPIKCTGYELSGVSFTDANTGTVVRWGPVPFLRTTNGGSTWVMQSSGAKGWLCGVRFADANKGTVVGEGGTILRTTTGGVTGVKNASDSYG